MRPINGIGAFVCHPSAMAVAAMALVAATAGCDPSTDGPTPVIEADDGRPISPAWLCRDQLTTEVTLSGSGFSPAPIDIPGDSRTALPRVTLTAGAALDGGEITSSVVVFGGEREQINANRLRWDGQEAMRFTVDQAVTLGPVEDPAAQSEGRLPAAVYDIEVLNPAGRLGDAARQIAAIDKPTLATLTPSIVCLEQGPRTVRVDGASVAVIDGVEAQVAIGALEPFAIGAFESCTEVPHGAVPGRLCTAADVPLAVDAVPVGLHPVTVQNPAPAACTSEEDITLRVVPSPRLDAVLPPLACVGEGDREVILQGADLLQIDGVLPAVTMTAEDGTAKAIEVTALGGDCVTLETQNHTVQSCTEATVLVPRDETITAPYQPTFTLDNPAPAGCGAVLEEAFVLTPPPRVDVAVPPAICTGEADRDVEIRGEGFIEVDGAAPAVTFGELAVEVTAFAECDALPVVGLTVRRCASMTVRVPQGALPVAEGERFTQPRVTVHNPDPAGCSDDDDGALTVLPAPTLAAAEPPLVCNAQEAREVVLSGAGFIVYDAAPPAVTLAGAAVEVTATGDCQDVPVRGAVAQSCTSLTVALPVDTLVVPDDADALVAAIDIQNPEPIGCGALAEGPLVAVPAPRVDGIEPGMLCDAGPTTFDLVGDGFLVVDGAPPAVTFDGAAVDPATVAPGGCVELTVDRLAVQSCTRLTLSVDPATLGASFEVAVANPAPAGCGDSYGQPVPVLPPPTVDAITPELICTADGDRALVITGRDFVQMGELLPAVQSDGAALTTQAAEDCVEVTVGLLTWQQCSTLRVTAPQGSLAPGRRGLTVTNPPPSSCIGEAPDAITVPPSPVLTAVEPRSICIDAGDRAITITGEGFLRVDGAPPALRLAGSDFAIEALDGCVPVDNGDGPAIEACTALTTTVPRGALPEGDVLVEVQNQGDGVCTAAAAELFDIVPVPRIDSVEPQAVCEQAGETFTVRGANFSDASRVTLGDQEAAVVFIDAETLEVSVADDVQPGLYDVTVDNADGCETTASAALRVAPRPVVFFVDPPVLYNGIALQATIYTTGLEAAPDEVRFEGPADEIEVLPGVPRPDRPNQVRVDIPAGWAPGLWSVQVTSDLGCVGRLDDGLTVTDDLTVGLGAVAPQYVAPDAATAITIDAAPDPDAGQTGFVATPRAYISPNPPEPGAPASALRAVVFVDDGLLSAVVPEGLASGDYDLIVVNPDATVGVRERALTVVEGTPPVIDEIIPASLDGNGPEAVELTGRGFDPAGVTVDLICRAPDGTEGTLPGQVDPADIEPERLTAILPGDIFPAGSVCLVRLTNDSGAFFDYSAVSIKTPAQNLNDWEAATPMTEPRRIPALVAARPTERSRFLYAIGGDDGGRAGAKLTVEAARVGVFGDLGEWTPQRNTLPAPRTLAKAVTDGDYVYLVGGHDGAAAVDTVLRAAVLDPLAGPEVVDLGLFLDDEVPGVAAGVWHYRITATFPEGSDNPGGESLPGEVLVVQLPAADGLQLQLIWQPVPGADGYRIYRTPAPGDGVDTVRLLATVEGGETTTFVDDGSLDVGEDTPLPPGSLGVWHIAGQMGTARAGAAVALADFEGSARLYALGGEDATGAVTASYEFAAVGPDLGAFTPGDQPLSAARADHAAWVLTAADAAAIPPGETWIFVGPGRTDGGSSRAVEAAPTTADGQLGWIATDNVNADVAGYGYGAANGFLFVFGRGGAAPDGGGISAELCTPDAGGSCRNDPPDPPDIRNWNALGVSFVTARAYMGSTQESAFFFVAGGMGPGGVLASTEQTVQ